MREPTIYIRQATVADAVALTAFGERTFRDAFAADNRPEDIEAYVSATYSLERQRAEIEDPALLTLVAEGSTALAAEGDAAFDAKKGKALVAYAQLRVGETPACVSGPAPIELMRFYVDRPWHGRGVAQTLMKAVIEAARERRARTLWLGVWERNARAITFYTRSGFRDVGSHDFLLGTDHQTDRIMVRPLD